MATIARKYFDKEIDRLTKMNRDNSALSSVSRNLNLLALQGTLAPVFHREAEVEAIQKLLLRRTKPNALLIGPAGCGKTAIAEATAIYIANQRVAWLAEQTKAEQRFNRALRIYEEADHEYDENGLALDPPPVCEDIPQPPLCDAVIYDLSMNSLLSGTKYRGDFEEKLQNVMNICKRNPNIILFIDEIHQMNRIGEADGASGMGQILKPALARAEVRVIGATTTEESAILKKDKALARRFSDVNIFPLVGEKALCTADNILSDYAKFHSIAVKEVTSKDVLDLVNFHIGGVFPNNFIDVIDETMSGARFEGKPEITMADIKQTLSRMTGKIIL